MKKYVIMVNKQFVTEDKSLTDKKPSAHVFSDLEQAHTLLKEISNIYGSAIIYDLLNNESVAVVMR